MPLLIILSIAQILFFLIGINTSPLVMIILPIGVIIFWWLINNPAISLMFLSLTAIIKGYLINYYPIFELIDITIVVTIIIWLGLIKMFIQALSSPKEAIRMMIGGKTIFKHPFKYTLSKIGLTDSFNVAT